MSRISRSSVIFCLLVGLLISSCSTPQPPQEWFGMQISPDQWQTEEISNALYQHGLLTHRALAGCRAWIMSQDPVYASGYEVDWAKSTHEEFTTPETKINLYRVKDKSGALRDTYFEILDISGRTGYDIYRLAYVLVEPGDDPIQCLEAVHTILNTLKPELFPDLSVAQG